MKEPGLWSLEAPDTKLLWLTPLKNDRVFFIEVFVFPGFIPPCSKL